MTDTTKPDVYERDDRHALSSLADGLQDLMLFAEALQIVEKYGLSVMFAPGEIEWTCTDPRRLYVGTANTPAGAVMMWDLACNDGEKQNRLSDGDAPMSAKNAATITIPVYVEIRDPVLHSTMIVPPDGRTYVVESLRPLLSADDDGGFPLPPNGPTVVVRHVAVGVPGDRIFREYHREGQPCIALDKLEGDIAPAVGAVFSADYPMFLAFSATQLPSTLSLRMTARAVDASELISQTLRAPATAYATPARDSPAPLFPAAPAGTRFVHLTDVAPGDMLVEMIATDGTPDTHHDLSCADVLAGRRGVASRLDGLDTLREQAGMERASGHFGARTWWTLWDDGKQGPYRYLVVVAPPSDPWSFPLVAQLALVADDNSETRSPEDP